MNRSKSPSIRLVLCTLLMLALASLTGAQPAHTQEHSALIAGVPNEIFRVGEFGVSIENSRLATALAGTGAIVDAFSYGRDFGHHKIGHAFFLWSVDTPAGEKKRSVPRSAHYREPPSETAADLYWAHDRLSTPKELGAHGKASDENTASPVPVDFPGNAFLRIARSLGLGGLYGEPTGSDDVDGFDPWPPNATMFEDDLFFSIDRSITIPVAGGMATYGPGDILLLPGISTALPENIIRVMEASDLGLAVGDDIDALSINLRGLAVVNGALVTVVEPTGWYSLKPGSPSLALDFTAGDIFQFELDAVYSSLDEQLHLPCSQLALCFTDVGTDVDSLGHIDPEGVQIPSHCPLELAIPGGGALDGFFGLEALPGQPLEFGKEFGVFEGSYAIVVDRQAPPGGALPGTVEPATLGPVPLDPGGIALVEFQGVRGTRDLIDHATLVFPPDPGAPPPVTGLTAQVDPLAMTVTYSWNPSAGSNGSELRVNGGPPQVVAPPFLFPITDPGEYTADVRAFATTPTGLARSEARFTVGHFEGQLAPPHALELVPGGVAPFDLIWQNPNPLPYQDVEIVLDGQLLAVVPAQNNMFPLLLQPGLHFLEVRGIGMQGATAATALRAFLPIDSPPQLPPTGHVPFAPGTLPLAAPGNTTAGTPHVTTVQIGVQTGNGFVVDVDVALRLSHPQPEGLRVTLTSPAGTTISLIEPLGVTGTVIDRLLDDVGDPGPEDDRGDVAPDGHVNGGASLSALEGELSSGTWTVSIENHTTEAASLENFELRLLTGGAQFRRGDTNGDGGTDIGDAVFVLGVIFPGGGPGSTLPCADAGDVNDDGQIDIGDPIFLLGTLFPGPSGPPPIPAPGGSCGVDPTADSLDCPTPPCP